MTPPRSRWLVPIAFLAFVSLGLPDGVVGVAWPSLRRSFGLPLDRLGLLLLAGMGGYLASSFGSGAAVARLGVGRLLLWSSVAVAASALLWSVSPWWPLIAGAAVVSGLGAGAIDAGINAFAAERFRPRIVAWLHASWGLGAMLGPILMTASLAGGLGWRGGYAILGASLLGMAACFRLTLGLWDAPPSPPDPRTVLPPTGPAHSALPAAAHPSPGPPSFEVPASELPSPGLPPAAPPARAGLLESLLHPRVRTNVILFFLCTGVESTAGQWAMSLLTESRGMAAGAAGTAVAGYRGGLFLGRLAFGVLAHHVAPARLLRVSTGLAPLAALLVTLSAGSAAGSAGLFALGFLLAPIFPLLIAETPSRVGAPRAAHAVGFQISAATLGAGTWPAAAGLVAGRAGLEALGPFLLAGALGVFALHEWTRRGSSGRGAGRAAGL
jgi:fucose permease